MGAVEALYFAFYSLYAFSWSGQVANIMTISTLTFSSDLHICCIIRGLVSEFSDKA